MPCETPILFCIFNRPLETQRVFERIAEIQPAKLFVIADGPRSDRPNETALVAQTREIINQIDWPCDLKVDYANENMGCRRRMASGISWAFEHTERLIILEDDCLPHVDFFGFCSDMLERFADDDRVMMISGDNFQPAPVTDDSYYFSRWTHIWGWATWRSAWQHFDVEVTDWPAVRDNGNVAHWCDDKREICHWTDLFNQQHANNIDTWDFPWMFACWKRGGLTILPRQNMVANIGFGDAATHTMDCDSPLANMPVHAAGPVRHPAVVTRNIIADRYTLDHVMLPEMDQTRSQAPNVGEGREHRLGRLIRQSIRRTRTRIASMFLGDAIATASNPDKTGSTTHARDAA